MAGPAAAGVVTFPAPASFRAAAAVALLDDAGRVLLVHQDYGKRRWNLPGGIVDEGEGPAEAAVREAAEEVGLEVELDGLVAVYFLADREPPALRFVFAARATGEPRLQDDGELSELGWFPPDALPDDVSRSVPYAVADAAAGARGVFRELG